MSQSQLPLFPADYTLINALFGFKQQNGIVYYFNGSLPIYQHAEDDELSFRFITSQMVVTSGVKQMDIVRACGVTKVSVQRSVQRFREGGIDGLRKIYAGGCAHVMTPGVCNQAQALLDRGRLPAEIGRALGIKADTIRKAIKRGDLHRPKKRLSP